MREYGQIQCAFWQSRTCRNLSDAARLLATYLLSGPHSNGIGCYVLPDGYVMGDLKWSAEKVSESFAELSRDGFADRFEDVVFIPDFIRWNGFRNENVAKARFDEFRALPPGMSKQCVAGEMIKWGKHLSASHVAELKSFSESIPNDSGTIHVISSEQNPTQPNPLPTRTQSTRDGKAKGSFTRVPRETPGDGWEFIDRQMRPVYPRGTFRHTHWIAASRTVERILADGTVDPGEILAGCMRYLAQQQAMGNEGTQFIVNPDKFLTERLWTEPFPLPAAQQRPREESPMERIQRMNTAPESPAIDGEVVNG